MVTLVEEIFGPVVTVRFQPLNYPLIYLVENLFPGVLV
jgi:hypothetical protein